ncbi:Diphthamide biosynthesis protein 3 [Coemansia sp. RSA 988]|nr:Diphthamide biosynthesis protein 3 [Coemansia sp. RSA 988]
MAGGMGESRASVLEKNKPNDTASSSISTNVNKEDSRGIQALSQTVDDKLRPATIGTTLNQAAAPVSTAGKADISSNVVAKKLDTTLGASVGSKVNTNATATTLVKAMALVNIDSTPPLVEAKRTTPDITTDTAKSSKQDSSETPTGDLGFYDEIEIEDMDFDKDLRVYHYPCPCGDRFEISMVLLEEGECIAKCPSCSLLLKVIYDADEFGPNDDDEVIELSTTIRVC